MPRSLSSELQDHLAGEHTTLAYCARLVRRDGTVLGFTSGNRPFTFESTDYAPARTVEASSVRASENAGVDNLDIVGLITADEITDVDLIAGKYDGATVTVFVVNYQDLTMGKLTLISGYIGEINFSDGTFSAEVRSLFQRLGQQIGELTSTLCRVKRFGDSRCKLDLAPYTFTRTVAQVDSSIQIRFGSDVHTTNFYTYGEVEFRSGANAGERREVKSHVLSGGQAVLILQLPFPFAVAVGDVAVLIAGCDRTSVSCQVFGNIANFRGEPFVPGTNQLMRVGRKLS
jgi:uncharacterized phage protein (TIGR02218 family)